MEMGGLIATANSPTSVVRMSLRKPYGASMFDVGIRRISQEKPLSLLVPH